MESQPFKCPVVKDCELEEEHAHLEDGEFVVGATESVVTEVARIGGQMKGWLL